MWNKIQYALIYSWVKVHALLPMWALYILSDILYVLVYKVVRYRVKVVRQNMKASFPDKSDTELRRLVDTLMEKGHTCFILLMGHYGNWEWFSGSTSRFKDSRIYQIYRPLNNQAFDRLFFNLRTQFGSFGIKKQDTVRDVITLKKDKTRCVVIFIADQTPSRNNLHYWTNFLNQDSSILTGPERLARKLDLPVIFLDTKQVKRGYYTIDMKLVTETPKETPENWIAEQYARLMEKCILRNPSGWLWTHKRWKHKRVESGELKVES